MSKLTVKRITVEHMQNPIGLDISNPRFGWILENNAQQNVTQQAYQLKLYVQGRQVADTGKIFSDESIEVHISNLSLTPKTRYIVNLEVWDNMGNAAASESFFETGFLDTVFSADWYEPKQTPTEKTWDEHPFHLESLSVGQSIDVYGEFEWRFDNMEAEKQNAELLF